MSTQGPTYEGRPLARPDEEVVDQGLGFDLGTMASRRQLLRGLGLGAAVLGLAACRQSRTASGTGTTSTSATTPGTASGVLAASAEIPDETAGPYPGDGSNGPDVLGQDGVVRSDLRSSFGGATGTAEGVDMTLELTLTDLAADRPYAGAAVYVWHCDREGRYSLYSEGVTGANYLRGVQVAGEDGVVRFTSIVPACYDGRWPHIHVEVYPDLASTSDSSGAVATSQVALPEQTCDEVYATAGYESSVRTLSRVSLGGDGVFGDDGGASQLATVTGTVDGGLTVRLAVGVDTRTAPTGGGMPGGPPPGR